MRLRSLATVFIVLFSLAACAEQTDWVKEKLGRQPDVEIDPAAVETIHSQADAKRFTVDETLIRRSLTEAIQTPGHFHWSATLIEANGGGLLYVGVKSSKVIEDAIDIDVIFKSPARGSLDIHLTLERQGREWVPKPDSYGLTEAPPNSDKKTAK